MWYVVVPMLWSIYLFLIASYISTALLRDAGIRRISISVVLWILSLAIAGFSEFTLFQYWLLTIFIAYAILRRPGAISTILWIVGLSVVPYLLITPSDLLKAAERRDYLRTERFYMQSLVNRVGRPPIVLPEALMGREVEGNLEDIERLLETTPYRDTFRARTIEWIHNATLTDFLDQDGPYGDREIRRTREKLNDCMEGWDWLMFPKSRAFTMPKGEIAKSRRPLDWEMRPLAHLHGRAIADFSFPLGFGYVKDRDHVAGFEGHRFFFGFAEKWKSWKIAQVELVSLLLHHSPAVYPSSHQLSRLGLNGCPPPAPCRPLNAFESESLNRIKRGEDLIVADVPQGLRMVGSIRNAKQCIQCHEGKRGDLLGAFSYSIEVVADNR